MPPAPRQGRKGGKISSSPAQHAASPGTVSPGTLPGSAMAAGLPDEPAAVTLEFNIETLMSSKRAKSTAATASTNAEKSANDASAAAAATSATPTLSSAIASPDNVLKFDVGAIEQIGQGTVIGGNKSVHTDIRKPQTSGPDIAKTAMTILNAAADAAKQTVGDVQVSNAVLTSIAEHDVVIFRRGYESLKAAIAVATRVSGSKILIVVPQFFEITSTADSVRKLLSTEGEKLAVGEMCGQTITGTEEVRIWVTSSETAILYLDVQRSFAPFTHVVFPDLTQTSPITSFLLWGTRERVFLRSANYDASAPPLHMILSKEGAINALQTFFGAQQTVELQLTAKCDVTDISYDAACAFAEVDVLEMDVDTSGKSYGPHPKLVSHTTTMAVNICKKLLSAGSCPQSIHVFTSEARTVVEALQKADLRDAVIFTGATPVEPVAADALAKAHHIYVQHRMLSFRGDANDGRGVHFVLDMGTSRRVAAPAKGESFIVSNRSGWASTQEVSDHKAILGYGCAGGYFHLYPPNVEAIFSATEPQCPIPTIESALLQSGRVGMNSAFASALTTPIDPASLELALGNLSEKGFIANALSSTSLTFLGEVASRLPLDVDVAHFVINCCAAGVAEVGVIIASVCALDMPRTLPTTTAAGGNGAATPAEVSNKYKDAILDARNKYAGDVARLSDLFADALLYMEWARVKATGKPTDALVQEICVSEAHLTRIQVFSGYLRQQLSDYSFIDDVCHSAEVIEKAAATLKSHQTALVFLESVSFARRACFVRNGGQLNLRDRAAAPVFIRTAKKVVASSYSASAVPWAVGTALISTDFRSGPTTFTCAGLSVVNNSYLFATLLLLSPMLEYSKPVEVADKGRVVYLGVTFNRQMKRFATTIDEAASILDFRESWCAALGYLQALRTSARPISRRRFELELKEEDRLFSFERFYTTLMRTFTNRATDFDISEHQGSFETDRVHYLTAKEPKPANPNTEASDVVMMKQFCSGDVFAAQAAAATRKETPASLPANAAGRTPPSAAFPASVTAATVFEDDDDDIEVIQESYFMTHGPIIDDDE